MPRGKRSTSELGHLLKRELRRRQLTAKDVARAAGVEPSFLYDLFRGHSYDPSLSRIARVARVLDVSLDWLAGTSSGGRASPSEAVRTDAHGSLHPPMPVADDAQIEEQIGKRE